MSLSFVPVLRRSCLFQENSATKRVSTMAYSRGYEILILTKTLSFEIHFHDIDRASISDHDHPCAHLE